MTALAQGTYRVGVLDNYPTYCRLYTALWLSVKLQTRVLLHYTNRVLRTPSNTQESEDPDRWPEDAHRTNQLRQIAYSGELLHHPHFRTKRTSLRSFRSNTHPVSRGQLTDLVVLMTVGAWQLRFLLVGRKYYVQLTAR